MTTKYIAPKREIHIPFSNGKFIFCRHWNSYYPSYYDIIGGCYVIQYGIKYTIIDPGYKTVKALSGSGIDTRLIENIIITHNHPDHSGGLIELMNLLFIQNIDKSKKYKLFLNPGTLKEYEHFGNDNFEIMEISCKKEYFLSEGRKDGKLENKFSFFAYEVPHKGIGEEQKTISLIFEILDKNIVLRFGITSDLDGDKKYMRYYKKIFNNLFFLVIHLGSLKFKKRREKKDKHLYPLGLYHLINKLDNVKAFIVQEFGLEMMEPKELANILSNEIFRNGYFFPFLLFNIHIIQEAKEIIKNLIAYLIPKFFTTFKKKKNRAGSFIRPKWLYNSKRLLELCYILCVDLNNIEIDKCTKTIKNLPLHNVWEKDNLNEDEINEISKIFDEFWIYMRNCLFFEKTSLDKLKIREFGEKIDNYFPECYFFKTIEKNCEILVNLVAIKKNEILEHFTNIFEEKTVHIFSNYPEIPLEMMHRILALEFTYFRVVIESKLKKLQIFPLLIFLSKLVGLKQPTLSTFMDLREVLLEKFQKFFLEKNLYLGSYGKVIDFNIFYDPYHKDSIFRKRECKECSMRDGCEPIRDGKFLFKRSRKCPYELHLEDLEYELREEYETYLHSEQEVEYWEAEREFRELEKKEKEQVNDLMENFYDLIQSKDYKDSLEILKKQSLKQWLRFDKKYSKYLELFLEEIQVKEIILKFFFESGPYMEYWYPNDYIDLYKIVQKEINERIIKNDKEFLKEFIKMLAYLTIKLRYIFRNNKKQDEELLSEFCKILKIIIHFILKTKEFNDEWLWRYKILSQLIFRINKKCKTEIRNIIYNHFKYSIGKEFQQKEYLLKIFESSDPKTSRIFEELSEDTHKKK